jgi:hypothetical protein
MLLSKPTILEYQMVSRIATTVDLNSTDEVNSSLVKARLAKQTKFDKNLIIHYTHEKRLQSNKKDIHQLWKQTFEQTPVMDTRLIIGTRNSRNTARELVHRHSKV